MRNWSQYRHPVGEPIFAAAAMQAITGGVLSWGCMCTSENHLAGMLVAFGMGAFIVSFLLEAYWARRRPRAAALCAVATELLLVLLIGLPELGEPVAVWYSQIPVALLLATAMTVAFHRRPHAAD